MQRRTLLELREIIDREEQLLSGYREEAKAIKGGQLVIRKKGDRLVFSEIIGTRERGITRNKTRVEELARKRFLKNEINYSEKVCDILKSALKEVKRADDYGKRGNISQILHSRYSQKDEKWIEEGDSNTRAPENLRYKTASGITVRSKSERVIADKLFNYGIPYRYDTKLKIGSKAFYPDFIIRRWDDKTVIWEHFGLMTDSGYLEHMVRKMVIYQEFGYSTSSNLICTFERDIENPDTIDGIIKRFLL